MAIVPDPATPKKIILDKTMRCSGVEKYGIPPGCCYEPVAEFETNGWAGVSLTHLAKFEPGKTYRVLIEEISPDKPTPPRTRLMQEGSSTPAEEVD